MKKLVLLLSLPAVFWLALPAQDFSGSIVGGQKVTIAVPDFRGSGNAQPLMGVFNLTLWTDLQSSGLFKLVPKTSYPLSPPQQPQDFVANPAPGQNAHGRAMTDWSGAPVNAAYLAFGYTGTQSNVLVLRGWLFDLSRPDTTQAQALAKNYTATADDAGARKVAHEYATDIINLFGGKSLLGTHIYFVHRDSISSPKEIWAMDYDGGNQHAITHFNSFSIEPSVSSDGAKIAFTSFAKGTPAVYVFQVEPTVRDLHFYNQKASVNSQPSFTPDNNQVVYSSSAGGRCCRIFIANIDGTGFRPITNSSFIDAEPKVNPKTGAEIVFTSGRSGPQQIYRMSSDGGDIERLTDGTGEAGNPAWAPSGQMIAYSWTRGYAAGKFNVFLMDVSSRRYTQLTHDEGRNENPVWAPDGAHLAFGSTRGGSSQIWTMLADGTQPHQITTRGINERPVWGK